MSDDGAPALLAALEESGFTEEGIVRASGAAGIAAVVGGDPTELFSHLTGADALSVLCRLFLLRLPCDLQALRGALPGVTPDELVSEGLLELRGSQARARVRLLPYAGLIIASSPDGAPGDAVPPDYVMGVGMSTVMLANLTVRRRVHRALDLGCGSGALALLAARHCDRAVALDRNPSATRMAALNIRLNGAGNCLPVQGDFLGPLPDGVFDLISINPPYVISPDSTHSYRDSGRRGDSLCRDLVRTAPRHLASGGYCQILCHWAHVAGEPWQERVASWCAGTGCDAWAMQVEAYDPVEYVADWCEAQDEDARAVAARRWLRSLEEQRIVAVGSGIITLRRSESARTWMRATVGPETFGAPCGDHVARIFEAQDFLAEHRDDSRLLEARLRVVPEARLDRFHAPGDGAWREIGARLRLTTGMSSPARVDEAIANFVGCCDGVRSVGGILGAMAAAGDSKSIAAALPAVRMLVEGGFVEAADRAE